MNARRFALATLLPLAAAALAALAAPQESATLVRPLENPRRVFTAARYPGWQTWNVSDPFVLRDGPLGPYLLFYAGSGTSRLNASVWDDWTIGVAGSADGTAFAAGNDYEAALVGRRWLEGDVLDPQELSQAFDSVAVFEPCVLHEGDEYRMWYTGWDGETVYAGDGKDRMRHQRIGLATSRDGRTWKKVPGSAGHGAALGLGPEGAPDAESVRAPFVRRERTRYRMWYEASDGQTTRILTATSSDGSAWERAGTALDVGAARAPDALGAGRPVVIKRRGRLELWYRGLAAHGRPYRLLRAASQDGVLWTKLPGEIDLWRGRAPQTETVVRNVLVGTAGECLVYFASVRDLPPGRDGTPHRGLEVFVATVNP